ncbi:unnamed protein product [Citrullus colocynthis]|uniref:Uncharacterized protein n=1 Tax=Citrullus colocynthis TaxID=252529 RepID=A0ABP0YFV6_9ROSI
MAHKFDHLIQTDLPFHSIDPRSLLLHQNSAADHLISLQLTPEPFSMERGPRYRAYAELRESKLRLRNAMYRDNEQPEKSTPPAKKQVKFVGSETVRKRSAAVAQSVPDFSAALRKENRKPPPGLSPVMEMTPPGKTWGKNIGGLLTNSRGSKSASAGEKRGGGLTAVRKSYAGFEELKGFSTAAANAINGENTRGGGRRGKTVLGIRQI